MRDLDSWAPKPEKLALGEDEIHIWRAYLDCDETLLRRFETTLASDERLRADRLCHQRDRNDFVATRGILRELLGEYLDSCPGHLEFDCNKRGKPFLKTGSMLRPVQFNVSHSRGLALLAFAESRHLGVDVELVRPEFAVDELAERYFSLQEVTELRALPSSLRADGFFLCWTRKEAYVKARGDGLYIPLESFNVSLTPGHPERLESADSLNWSLRSIHPDSRYVGALVAEGIGWRLRYWDWEPALGN